jgi:hypothetical protein
MNGVQPGRGERRERSDRRAGGRRRGEDRRAWQRRLQFNPVAVDHRKGDERRASDRRTGVGRRILADRRAFSVGD